MSPRHQQFSKRGKSTAIQKRALDLFPCCGITSTVRAKGGLAELPDSARALLAGDLTGSAVGAQHEPVPVAAAVGAGSTQHSHPGLQDLSVARTGEVAGHPGQGKRYLANVVAEHRRQLTVADIPVDEHLEGSVVVPRLRDLSVARTDEVAGQKGQRTRSLVHGGGVDRPQVAVADIPVDDHLEGSVV